MSWSAGPGSPLFFRCPRARRERFDDLVEAHERVYEVTLTGRTRPYRANKGSAIGIRSTFTSYEYECECGHKGWSNHIDLARRAKLQGISPYKDS